MRANLPGLESNLSFLHKNKTKKCEAFLSTSESLKPITIFYFEILIAGARCKQRHKEKVNFLSNKYEYKQRIKHPRQVYIILYTIVSIITIPN